MEKSHEEAQRICTSNGGRLFEPKNKKENKEVAAAAAGAEIGSEWWIGVDDKDTEGRFQWSSNKENINFSNWASGAPNGNEWNGNCVNMFSGSYLDNHGKWLDIPCYSISHFICEFT